MVTKRVQMIKLPDPRKYEPAQRRIVKKTLGVGEHPHHIFPRKRAQVLVSINLNIVIPTHKFFFWHFPKNGSRNDKNREANCPGNNLPEIMLHRESTATAGREV